MTFTEAAAEVLRIAGKPLHYKEITELAIEKNLLSHVGKSPEVTMGARLAALLKKEDKENPIVRVKPGVFYDAETLDRLRVRLLDLAEARDGAITLAQARDELGTSRKYAQALLEHLDARHLTVRQRDRHILRRAAREGVVR